MNFRAVFPCGHEKVQEGTHMYGCKCCGKRPVELHIDGNFPKETLKYKLKWHFPIVHPVVGKVYYNGELVHG